MTRIHVSFPTAHLAASTAFYTTLFGEAPDKVRSDYARFQPRHAPITLSLLPGSVTAEGNHYGLKLPDRAAVQQVAQRLTDGGIATREEANTSCCYAVQDKVWATDPDGRAWEIYVVTDDLAPSLADEGGTCCTPQTTATGCCG